MGNIRRIKKSLNKAVPMIRPALSLRVARSFLLFAILWRPRRKPSVSCSF